MKYYVSKAFELLTHFDEYFQDHITDGKEGRIYTFLLKIFYLLDIVLSFLVHGSYLTDYFLYQFYNRRHRERMTFATVGRAKRVYAVTHPKYKEILRDKLMTIHTYEEYFERSWLYVPKSNLNEFRAFCKKHAKLIAKPRFGGCANGIMVIDSNDYEEEFDTLYASLKNGDYILEEFIEQHSEMAALHPFSVNTLRVTTIMTKTGPQIAVAILRMGNDHSSVDNRSTGGIVANVDLETGRVYTTGVDKWLTRYVYHPVTKTKIVGFEIPQWNTIVETTKKIAEKVPEIMYAGWDIALSKTGKVVLIEGNSHAMMFNCYLSH